MYLEKEIEAIDKHNNELWNSWELKINSKVYMLDIKNNRNEVILHHYLINQMRVKCSYEVEGTLRDMEYKTGLTFAQLRTSINKLEAMGIIEIEKGRGKTPSIYKYIMQGG